MAGIGILLTTREEEATFGAPGLTTGSKDATFGAPGRVVEQERLQKNRSALRHPALGGAQGLEWKTPSDHI